MTFLRVHLYQIVAHRIYTSVLNAVAVQENEGMFSLLMFS